MCLGVILLWSVGSVQAAGITMVDSYFTAATNTLAGRGARALMFLATLLLGFGAIATRGDGSHMLSNALAVGALILFIGSVFPAMIPADTYGAVLR
jgi:hypothetical protein